MCYDVSIKKSAYQRKAEMYDYGLQELEKIFAQTKLPLYHTSGFSHPVVPIINKSGIVPGVWGLLPFWAKDRKLMNRTLNARSETMHEKNAFKNSVNNRCVILVDGFFEHHHYNGKTYPFLIRRADNEPFYLACLFSNWTDNTTGEVLTTFTIATTKANNLLSKLHNNPKLSFGPRMPVILPDNDVHSWLSEDLATVDVLALAAPYPVDGMIYHTVNRLRGKAYPGNIPEIVQPFDYPELEYQF